MYLFLYTFLLVSGDVLTAEREAHTDNWRPVRTYEQCISLAEQQETRLIESIMKAPDPLFTDAKVRCVKRQKKGRKKR